VARVLAAVLSSLLACAAHADVRRVALLVSHSDGGVDTEPLRYVERDARKLRDVLVELGGFEAEDTTLLVGPTADQVVEAVEAVEATVAAARAAGERTLLLFYYSGHAASGEIRLGDSRLDLRSLRRMLSASQADVRIGLLDACQSGAITRLKGGTRGPSFVVDLEPDRASSGYVLITSSSDDEASQESEDLRGSFFTHYLVSGLRGAADRSGDAQVTLDEAYVYAYDRTVAHTAGTRGGTQHPTYTYDLQGNGAVVLTRLEHQGALVFPTGAAGRYLVYDLGRDAVVGEVEKPAGRPSALAVPPGRYAIKKRGRDHLLLAEVTVSPRQRAAVEEASFRAVAFEDDVTKGPTYLRRRRELSRRFGLSLRGGYQAFFDESTRDTLFHPSAMVGLRADATNLVAPNVSLHADAAFGQASEALVAGPYEELHPVEFTLVVAGTSLTYDWWLGDALVQAGPRFSGLYARRRFEDGVLPFQDLFTFSPGFELGAWFFFGPVSVGLSGRVHYLRYATELEDRSLGFGEGYLSVGVTP